MVDVSHEFLSSRQREDRNSLWFVIARKSDEGLTKFMVYVEVNNRVRSQTKLRSNLPALSLQRSGFINVVKNSRQLCSEGRLLREFSNDELS
jgi:hypothetical protein